MNLKEVVGLLRRQGNSVIYRTRKDGSIRIKSINGMKYKKSQGNAVARAMTGQSLSSSQLTQRAQARSIDNVYKPKEKAHVKKTEGLTKSQREFISKYNARVKRVNARYNPKKPLTNIGAKQARQAMARGKSFQDWRRAAIAQAKARALDLPKGVGGTSEKYTLAQYIRKFHPNNPEASKVAKYIEDHMVSQSYLETLHDLAYRKDSKNIDWGTALEKAKESNKKIKQELAKIRKSFNAI